MLSMVFWKFKGIVMYATVRAILSERAMDEVFSPNIFNNGQLGKSFDYISISVHDDLLRFHASSSAQTQIAG